MNNTPAPPPPLPADQEAAHSALMVQIEEHENDGRRIPCRGPEARLWISPRTAEQRDASEACNHCPAVRACAAYAIAYNERSGVWGGLSATGREQLRTKTRRTAA